VKILTNFLTSRSPLGDTKQFFISRYPPYKYCCHWLPVISEANLKLYYSNEVQNGVMQIYSISLPKSNLIFKWCTVNKDEEMATKYWRNNQINFFSKKGNVLAYAI
jgi:hypothetical protein